MNSKCLPASFYAPSVADFHTAEMLECHRLLDSVGMPKSGFDEQLSISQRVDLAVRAIHYLRSLVNEAYADIPSTDSGPLPELDD